MNTSNVHTSGKATRNIYSITPFTLLDYPGHPACIIWFAGCNMRCSYCYNPDIVLGKGHLTYAGALDFLRSRRGLLEGVVLSGGECLLHTSVLEFAFRVKDLGFLIKVDTNGSRPDVLKALVEESLADYVSLDFKALPDREITVTGGEYFEDFSKCLDLLLDGSVTFEVRTTVHSGLLQSHDLLRMSFFLAQKGYSGVYYLQKFQRNVLTLGEPGPDREGIDLAALEASPLSIQIRG